MATLEKIGSTSVKQNWISLPTRFVENLIVLQTTIQNLDDWNSKIRSGGLFRVRYPTFNNLVTKPEYFPVDNERKLYDIGMSSELVEYIGNKKFEPLPKEIQFKLSSQLVDKYSISSFAPWAVTAYKIIE